LELERLKTDFIGRVSHELRTPITIIDGFVETILTHDDALDSTQRRDMLERCRNATARLGGLIESLITLARLETGVLAPVLVPVDVAALLEAVGAEAAEPGSVTVEATQGTIVRTDPDLLQRAISFIVDNAVKYGGAAYVRTSGDGRLIEVRDPGPGIPADVRATLFELFTRSITVTSVPGLGLGLPMARTLLGVLGGQLDIADTPQGDGTLVRIRLP
jgi:signal transduction histidine kinase